MGLVFISYSSGTELFLKEDVFRSEGSVRAVLYLEYGGWFEHFDTVPLTGGDLDTVVTNSRVEEVAFGGSPEVVVENHEHSSAQYYVGFPCVGMAINGEG